MYIIADAKPDLELELELAIDVLRSKDLRLILALKNFLAIWPSPKYIEEILKAALYLIAETEPDTCRWLLQNRIYLMPELDIIELANNFMENNFKRQDLILNREFKFEQNRKLYLNEQAQAELAIEISACDRLLLEEILLFNK